LTGYIALLRTGEARERGLVCRPHLRIAGCTTPRRHTVSDNIWILPPCHHMRRVTEWPCGHTPCDTCGHPWAPPQLRTPHTSSFCTAYKNIADHSVPCDGWVIFVSFLQEHAIDTSLPRASRTIDAIATATCAWKHMGGIPPKHTACSDCIWHPVTSLC
jgi:hypothetical protein